MATTVSMPQLGETVTEGTILKWSKQVGDQIREDEVLVEISTDKVDTEVPSPVSGTILEILVEEGDTVEVGVDLVVIGGADESSPPSSDPSTQVAEPPLADLHPASETPAGPDTGFEAGLLADTPPTGTASEESPAQRPTDEEVEAFFSEPATDGPQLLSPVVRRLVRENNVDIAMIRGTGQGGRITRKDVEAHLETAPAASEPVELVAETPAVPIVEAPDGAASSIDQVSHPQPESEPEPVASAPPIEAVTAAGSEVVELDRLRVRIAENNIKAKQTAAHVWTSVEVDFERVERVRQSHKGAFKQDEGFSLTYLPFISRATIDALKTYPVVNSSFNLEEKTATFHKKVDLGIAIDLNQGGLVVARVRNADGLRLVGIAREISDLAERGRSGSLGVDDVTGSTFTITNPGPFGSFMSAPIINVPNVAILSTDTIIKRPTVVSTADGQDMIAIRHIGYLGLSWDHRAFDGSTAVLFLNKIKENIQTWDWEQELA
ncbi:MAG: 2-oxo acid dehydrogenase subunit E2 [Acidimicrobiia bacterium]